MKTTSLLTRRSHKAPLWELCHIHPQPMDTIESGGVKGQFSHDNIVVCVCVWVVGEVGVCSTALGVQLTQALSAEITCSCRFVLARFIIVCGTAGEWMNYPLIYTNSQAELRFPEGHYHKCNLAGMQSATWGVIYSPLLIRNEIRAF